MNGMGDQNTLPLSASPEVSQPWAVVLSVHDLKLRFAGFLYERPDTEQNRWYAARLLFPRQDQTALALIAAKDWPDDPVVIAELDRLGASGTDQHLPTRNDVARRYINMADDKTLSADQRIKALDKYAELMGQKPTTSGPGFGGVVVNNDNRRVFVLPQAERIEVWEKQAAGQQAKLIEGNASAVK